MEEMTDEGQVYRLEGGNKGGRCFPVEKLATWQGLVLGMHRARTEKMGSREKGELVWGGVEEGVLDVEKRAIM